MRYISSQYVGLKSVRIGSPMEMEAVAEGDDDGGIFRPFFSVFQGPVVALALLLLLLCFTTPRFLSVRNYLNIIEQVTRNGIIALGMTFVILTGGIDLSVGSTFVLSMMTFGVLAA